MLRIYCWVKSRMRDERGSNGAEYALLIALIAIAIVVGVTAVGTGLNGFFNQVSVKVGAWTTAAGA